MSIPDPTIAPAKLYLFTQTKAAALFADPVLVCYDEPGPYAADDIVTFGTVHWHPSVSAIVGSGGAHFLQERYDVELVVDSFRGGDNGRATFERAVALFNGVIQVLRADLSLGGIVLVAKPGEATITTTHDEAHKGWISRVESHIECYQQI